MAIPNPFNVDAALASEAEIDRLPVQGGAAARAFCGVDASSADWDERGVCVLKSGRGFGKSHLLFKRSLNHRKSGAANHTLFYPPERRPRVLCDRLSNMHAIVPRWLEGREGKDAWLYIWQLAIVGLLVWITGARSSNLKGYAHWFEHLQQLDQTANRQEGAVADDRISPVLSLFIIRLLARMPEDYASGLNQLKDGLFHANSEWSIAIAAAMARLGKRRIAIYLDAPDELVEVNPASLWRNVQQGLLLAIWKFSKSGMWSQIVSIYATVRSEAFGSRDDHPDITLAMGLVMPLRYSRADLEAMLDDRIQEADPAKLALPLSSGSVRPVHALCGFDRVVHQDRKAFGGGQYTEEVTDSILRHTRLVPREVIRIAGGIYEMVGARDFVSVRSEVNAKACRNIDDAIKQSFVGWNSLIHGRFAALLSKEVIDAETMEQLASKVADGPGVIKLFVRYGLLGTAERQPHRHRHYYLQRFVFDEAHGNEDASSLSKDYYFVHPALKEWIRSLEVLNTRFEPMEVGVVGDRLPYQAKPPAMRLAIVNGKLTIKLYDSRRLTVDKGARSDPLRFLFVVLAAYKTLRVTRINPSELRETWAQLRTIEQVRPGIRIHLAREPATLEKKIQDWAKKVNKDKDIQEFQTSLTAQTSILRSDNRKSGQGKLLPPFMTANARSTAGAQIEITIPNLSVDNLDWDDTLYSLVSKAN